MVVEDIVVRFRMISEGIRGKTQAITKDIRGFNFVMGQNMEQFKKNAPVINDFGNKGAKLGQRFRLLTHGMRGFRMEMLSVMFFGMAITRFFSGLIRPAFEAVGVFKLFSETLKILFLPTALEVLDKFSIPFLNAVSEMPEPLQQVAGDIALLGLALGGFLSTLGAVTLGLGGTTAALGTLKLAIAAVSFTGLMGGAILLGAWLESLIDDTKSFEERWVESFDVMKNHVKVEFLDTMETDYGLFWGSLELMTKVGIEAIEKLMEPFIFFLEPLTDFFRANIPPSVPGFTQADLPSNVTSGTIIEIVNNITVETESGFMPQWLRDQVENLVNTSVGDALSETE